MRLVPLLAVLAACVLAGCGESDEDQVRRAGIAYLDGLLERRYERACSVMSTTLRAEVLRQSRESGERTRDCATAVERILSSDPARRAALQRRREAAPSATVAVNGGFAVMGDEGDARSGEHLFFIRQGGDWKLHPRSPG